MSETLSPPSQDEHELDQRIAEAGKELASQIPWEKTHEDLYDETGALTTDGRIAQAAVNRVPNPDFRAEHENGLLDALNASRVHNVDVAREAADAEKSHRDFAQALDKVADTHRTKVDESGDFQDGKLGVLNKRKNEYDSVPRVRRLARKLVGRSMPAPELTLDSVSNNEVKQYFNQEAHKQRKKANEASDEVVRSHQPWYNAHHDSEK